MLASRDRWQDGKQVVEDVAVDGISDTIALGCLPSVGLQLLFHVRRVGLRLSLLLLVQFIFVFLGFV